MEDKYSHNNTGSGERVEITEVKSAVVPLKTLLDAEEFRNSKAILPVAVGCDTAGNPCIIDLAEAPHILMAGATKQGKTTSVHSLVLSLLRSGTPDYVKFVLIDPKGCELTAYKALDSGCIWSASDAPGVKVSTTPESADRILSGLCREMEDRCESSTSYGAGDASNVKKPYIIVVIDEYADLVSFPGRDRKSVEMRDRILEHILCLSRKGRAAGIHLVITTQNLSNKVISREIKDNFPTRMAFRVISRRDSRTVIDKAGAECLAGSGDMLLKYGDEIMHVRACGVSGDELEKYISQCCK
jgi:DNA segregation ATPase FtsK/SpoIIIE, S-DNA-T family